MYAPLAPRQTQDSPVLYSYPVMKLASSSLVGYVKVKMDVNSVLAMAESSPYPNAVRLAVMKQVASNKEITLAQLHIILGFAAKRAQAAVRR